MNIWYEHIFNTPKTIEDLFHIAAGLLPQVDLEIKQTLKQNRMKSKKAKTRKHFFLLNSWDFWESKLLFSDSIITKTII